MAITPEVNERLVAAAWERQAFDPAVLRSLGLGVVFRGVPSDAGGPDFQDAILSLADGTLLHGDVEFHVHTSDWLRHGHTGCSRYDRVILHVVWKDDGIPIRRSDGSLIPVLPLAGCLNGLSPASPALAVHGCVGRWRHLTTAGAALIVREAGQRRFGERSDLLAAEIEAVGPDQALYAALLEGMGHSSNRAAFRRLADLAPLAWLLDCPPAQRTASLLHAAGLGPIAGNMAPGCMAPDEWRLTRLRPGNHPAVRIAGAVELFGRMGMRPADRLLDMVSFARGPNDLRALLIAGAPGERTIGQGRADELAASVILPFVAALEPEIAARALFLRYPSPPSTRWTRMMLDILRQAGHELPVKFAVDHQGLHYLYTRHCRREGSADCPLCGSKKLRVVREIAPGAFRGWGSTQAAGVSGSMSYQSLPTLASTSSGTLS